jgi:hypothetical protein
MKRQTMSKGRSKAKFRKTAGLVHKSNFYNPIKRGGTRL